MIISSKTYYVDITWRVILKMLLPKFAAVFIRIKDLIRLLPLRLVRIGMHLFHSFSSPSQEHPNTLRNYPLHWFLELFTLILDSIGITELYETFLDFAKFNTRPLTKWEKNLGREIFGNTINYDRVRLDEYALAGPRQFQLCYVSFYTINSWGAMQNSLFLHELTHVWQYENLGATYIPRALSAQYSKIGYNYGGVSVLKKRMEEGVSIHTFNLEQQADIVSDYYRLREGYAARWDNCASFQDLPIYEYFIKQFQ